MKKQDLIDYVKSKSPSQEAIERMRVASGSVSSSDRIVILFYHLLRDHLTPGQVETLVQEVESFDDEALFTNGWLARYAQNLRDRMFGVKNGTRT